MHARFLIAAMAAASVFLALAIDPAFAHHPMGGTRPETLLHGFLSGLGHPVIGLDHLAAVVAVGCLAGIHRGGALLAVGFVLAMLAGVAVHVGKSDVPAAEILVAVSVVALGAALVLRNALRPAAVLALLVVAGLLHGYALGESIVGAEPTPLLAYFVGLAVVQSAIALAAMAVTRMVTQRAPAETATARLVGAGIAGFGIALLVQQVAGA